ncbi:uncharacterized protein MELLADRAFT_116008 [Melampsora larici-populina 98AG31]|uniref:MPN domain-containing protein n=1 Tax=Melampsora larici-populina (strain 98AG31 / pathotype 3-4-7) TaxID=747676 RepID=F4RG64_MELLP|nr:uncharacterized protein MELLADRAFT_116008 [Melampsora larici-populina 98AG31]EGG08555.1 hypothetical protein MELLADRAFT_116008 [Melampsora larici-populina 98AG31]
MFAYSLLPKSAIKAILHASKYPHSTVIGLLLGSIENESVSISDAIPLVHHWSDLSPMLEAGLAIADGHARSSNLMIVGTYVARARLDDRALDWVSQQLNSLLEFKHPIALVIDNTKLRKAENPFIPFLMTDSQGSWSNATPNQFNYTPSKTLTSCQPTDLADFDDHLEDIGLDWLVNPSVTVVSS